MRAWLRTSAAKFLCEQRPELQHPSSDRFIGDVQPAACRMMSGGIWWRANEISIGHLPTKEMSATVGATKPPDSSQGFRPSGEPPSLRR
jgi:hypothetical protein